MPASIPPILNRKSSASSLGLQDHTPGSTRILKWKDGKRAVFMVEFDDSAPSHLELAIPALKNRGIPGTFYINPGNGPYKSHQAAWERAAASPLIELANHTFKHLGAPGVAEFDDEIAEANAVIDRLYPQRPATRLRSWARPGVPADHWRIGEAEIQAVLTKYHMIERPPFYGPPFSIKTTAEMIDWVEGAVAGGEMRHLVFHGVGGDWHPAPLNYFLALLDKLEACSDRLWLTDPLSWHKYETERRTATVDASGSTETSLTLVLTSEADPRFYDEPLTLVTRVPDAWKRVTVTQGKTRRTLTVKNGEVRFDASPGRGDIVIK
jgi:peptidoglycan/xylan/chitin deacetylase (PgdA/CDA1 family)